MKIKRLDLMELLFVLLILGGEHFFYIKSFPITDLDFTVVIAIVMFFLYLFYYKGRVLKNSDNGTKIVLFTFALMAVTSAIRAQQSYGQSIILGLRPQRYYLILLAYFPIKNVILKRENGLQFVIHTIVGVGVVAAIIYSVQYLVFPYINFLTVGYDYRFGQVRLRFNEVWTLFSMFYVYYKLIKQPRWKWGILFAIHIFYYVEIIKGRYGIIVLTLVLAFLTILVNRKKWKAAISITAAVVILLYAPIPIVDQYFEGFRAGMDSYQSGTDVRYKGQKFYMESISEDIVSLIFGKGYVNTQSSSAVQISRAKDFYIVDNGYFGLAYFYGLFGVVGTMFTYLYIAIKAYKLQKGCKNGIDGGLGVGVYLMIASVLVPYVIYYYVHCLLVVILALLEEGDSIQRGEQI